MPRGRSLAETLPVLLALPAFLALLALAPLVGGCSRDAPPADAAPERRMPVEVITAATAPFVETYRITAVAAPDNVWHLSAEVGGTLLEIKADQGDRVVAGDVLARFDPEPFELARDTRKAELERAKVRLALANKTLKRQQGLHRQGSVSDSLLEEAELAAQLAGADLKLAELALTNAERDLKNAVVTAPAAGEITRRFPEPGAVVAPGQPLFHLASTGRIRLVAGLSESQVVHVKEGGEAQVRFDALPGEVFTGRIDRVGSVDQPGEATFPVEVTLNNPDGRIRPGMVARLTTPGRKLPDTVRVPALAVRTTADGPVLFVLADGAARKVPVTLAALVDESAVITAGVQPGQRVIVVGHTALKGGEKVQVTSVDGRLTGQRDAPSVDSLP